MEKVVPAHLTAASHELCYPLQKFTEMRHHYHSTDQLSLTRVLMGVLRGQQGPLASQPWACYVVMMKMPCSWSKILTLLCLFSFLTVFLPCWTRCPASHERGVSEMCLRCADYKQDLLPCFLPCHEDKYKDSWVSPYQTHIYHSFTLTFEVEELESLECYFSSYLRCIALVLPSSPGLP